MEIVEAALTPTGRQWQQLSGRQEGSVSSCQTYRETVAQAVTQYRRQLLQLSHLREDSGSSCYLYRRQRRQFTPSERTGIVPTGREWQKLSRLQGDRCSSLRLQREQMLCIQEDSGSSVTFTRLSCWLNKIKLKYSICEKEKIFSQKYLYIKPFFLLHMFIQLFTLYLQLHHEFQSYLRYYTAPD
jgi:hypothetical protein